MGEQTRNSPICSGSKVISTIQHPQKGKVKGSAESFTFNSSYISTPISLMAEEMLHSVSEGEYEYIFGWNEKPIIEGLCKE